jgi:AcrR family transcriptional regulator
MVTIVTAKREVGRPRAFADEQVFLATAHALARLGYGRLTLAAVADEVGCTRQALLRRFGSKHALVRAYLEWIVAGTSGVYRELRAAHTSPLAALRARFLMPVEERPYEVADPVGHGNILGFFVGARDDPEFRALLAQLMSVYQTEVARLVAEAQQAGEIGDGDPAAIAHVLIAATTGELLLWAADPSGSAVDRIARVFDAVIAPYASPEQPSPPAPLPSEGEGSAPRPDDADFEATRFGGAVPPLPRSGRVPSGWRAGGEGC